MATPRQTGRLVADVVALIEGGVWCKTVMVPKGQTVGWVVNACGIYQRFPLLRENRLGVWGRPVAPDSLVEEGDRIEVYVPVTKAAVAAVRG